MTKTHNGSGIKAKTLAAMREGVQRLTGLRLDDWGNLLTGLGTSRDKTEAAIYSVGPGLNAQQIRDLLAGNDLARTIVFSLPDTAFREGFLPTFAEEGENNEIKIDAVKAELARLKVHDKCARAAWLSRAYGGAKILVGVRSEGGLVSEPLEQPPRIDFLTVFDKRSLSEASKYQDPLEEKFDEAESYFLHPIGGGISSMSRAVHETRLIHFPGIQTDPETRTQRGGWDLSVLDPVMVPLRQVGVTWQSLTNMIQDTSQGVLKMDGYIDALAEHDTETISTRTELMDMTRSVARMFVLDTKEDFSYVDRGSLGGLDGILQQGFLRLSGAARMPVFLFFGQAPAGLNASGAVDLRWWYDTAAKYQKDDLTPPIVQIVRMIAGYLFPGDKPESWGIEWPSLWQMTPEEEANLHKKQAEIDQAYVTMGALDPLEVALSRFRDGRFTMGYSAVDLEHKRAILEADAAMQEDPSLDPEADPNAEPGSPPPEDAPEDPEEKPAA